MFKHSQIKEFERQSLEFRQEVGVAQLNCVLLNPVPKPSILYIPNTKSCRNNNHFEFEKVAY